MSNFLKHRNSISCFIKDTRASKFKCSILNVLSKSHVETKEYSYMLMLCGSGAFERQLELDRVAIGAS